MLERLQQNLLAGTGQAQPTIAVAVSGGRDSMALLHMLCALRDRGGGRVRALHVNHGLRKESRLEALMVQQACKTWEVPLLVIEMEVARQKTPKESIEMAARRLRYQAMRQALAPGEWLCTAHHQGDMAETVLMHILCGSGVRGLRGIGPKQGRVLRPLLWASRKEIYRYIQTHRIAFCEDASNQNTAFLRNRLRHQLLPQLAAQYNPKIEKALCGLARAAAEDEAFFQNLAAAAMRRAQYRMVPGGGLWMDRAALQTVEKPVRTRIWQHCLEGLHLPVSQQTMREMEKRLAAPGHDQLPRGFRVKGGKWLELYRPDPLYQSGGALTDTGAAIGPWRFTVSVADKPAGWPGKQALFQFFDADALQFPLEIRPWRPGDTIPMPYGQKKISDVYQDEKTPMALRCQYPLGLAKGQVVWAPGVVRSQLAKISSQSRRMLRIEFIYTLEEEPV